MKKGDVVKVYERPYTCEELEGTAVLVKFIQSREDERVEQWEVCFQGDDPGSTYLRMINVENH